MNMLVHWEIPSTDVQRSARFYADLFGWQMQSWSDDYMLFSVEAGTGGGISKVDQVGAPAISVYIGVDDIPAMLAHVEALGGKIVRPKIEIGGNMGFMAFFTDPCGCELGLWSQA
jgi:predicted enzyme related to lactoylglutathione lyase